MNKQEIFNKVRDHLVTQGVRSKDTNGHCAYRGDYGRKCAIGCLIKDEQYKRSLEGWNVFNVDTHYALKVSGVVIEDDDDRIFLNGLQTIHDNQAPPEWSERLRIFAITHDLQP